LATFSKETSLKNHNPKTKKRLIKRKKQRKLLKPSNLHSIIRRLYREELKISMGKRKILSRRLGLLIEKVRIICLEDIKE
jgi:hypothetical protein